MWNIAQRFAKKANEKIIETVQIQGSEIDDCTGLTPLQEMEPWLLIDNPDLLGEVFTYEKVEDDGENFIVVFDKDLSAIEWHAESMRWFPKILVMQYCGSLPEEARIAANKILEESYSVEDAESNINMMNDKVIADNIHEYCIFSFQDL